MTTLVVVCLIESDDPRLAPGSTDSTRWEAVADVLPHSIVRVLAAMPECHGAMMLYAHGQAMDSLGLSYSDVEPQAIRARRH